MHPTSSHLLSSPRPARLALVLAGQGHVAASTQSQALSAMLFLYQQVLKQDIGWLHRTLPAPPQTTLASSQSSSNLEGVAQPR